MGAEAADVTGAIMHADKKSHYTAYLIGFGGGALVSVLIVLAVAMVKSGGL